MIAPPSNANGPSPQGASPLQRALSRAAACAALTVLAVGLSGCGTSIADIKDDMSLDGATLAFVDPARYDYYDCKQLETERKNLAKNIEGLKAEMKKADTGFAGPVVSEMVYRNDYIANIGQAKAADQAWRRNKCHETLPDPLAATATSTPPADGQAERGRHSKSGSAVY